MTTYNHNDEATLRETLIGRSITSVQFGGDLPSADLWSETEGKVTLDDGTELLLGGNDGGCSCGAGDYDLIRLNDMPINGIMNVEVVEEADGDERYEPDRTYRIFVLAQDERFRRCSVELAAFEGNDGNGYYGTGFWFTVVKPEEKN